MNNKKHRSGHTRPVVTGLTILGSGLVFAAQASASQVLQGVVTEQSPLRQVADAASGAQSSNTSELEEIVVAARRAKENLQRVPLAVTAFSDVTLQKLGIQHVEDLRIVTPGLNIVSYEVGTLLYEIRGQINDNPKAGQDASVGLYVNEVPYNIPNGTDLALFDLQDTEVLKGPQGTLFGRNTTGGAVLLNTARPTDEFEGYAQMGGTFFSAGTGYESEGVFNIPVSSKVDVRVGVSTEDRDGYIKNIINPAVAEGIINSPLVKSFGGFPNGPTNFQNLGGVDSKAWRFSAIVRPTDDFENFLFYQGGISSGTTDAADSLAVYPASASTPPTLGLIEGLSDVFGWPDAITAGKQLAAAQKNYFWSTYAVANLPYTVNTEAVSDTATWTLGNITLKNILGYRLATTKFTQDFVGLPGIYGITQTSEGGHDFSEEFQVQGKTENDMLHWVTGLFYFNEHDVYGNNPVIIFGGLTPSNLTHADSSSYSAFAQATQKIPELDGLSLTGGVRYTVDHKSSNATSFIGNTCELAGLPTGTCILNGRATFRNPTYTVSLDYQFDPKTLVYVATRLGYRAGGFNADPSSQAGFQPFQPERVTDYEIGLKRDWSVLGRPLRTDVALYTQNYTNIQRLEYISVTQQAIINAASAQVNGGELEVSYRPLNGLDLSASVALCFPEYNSFEFNGQNLAGETFGFVPNRTLSLVATYTLPVPTAIGTVQVNGNYYYQSKTLFDDELQTSNVVPQSIAEQEGYGLLNFGVHWLGAMESPVDVNFTVKNVMNAKVTPFGSTPLYSAFGVGYAKYSVPPRMFGLNMRYNF